MPDKYYQPVLLLLRLIAKFASAAMIAIALLVLVGWQLDIAFFKSGIPGLTAMNPGGTAVCFMLSGLGIWLSRGAVGDRARSVATIVVSVMLVVPISWFVANLAGWENGIDTLLFREKLDMEAQLLGHANRLAPNTAATFILLGLAVILLDRRWGRIWPAQILAFGTMLSGLLTVIGYAHKTFSLAGIGFFLPMALNTALLFIVGGIAVLCLRPERGAMGILAGMGAGGSQARKLLPVAFLVPPLVGIIGAICVDYNFLRTEMLPPIFVLANMLIFTALVWRSAALLEESDHMRSVAEEALSAAKNVAEQANQMKTDFLANMSHELRTPLNSIIGLSRMLHEDMALDAGHRDTAGIVRRSADNLLGIVNDILDISKIEAGTFEFDKIVFSIEEVLNNISEIFLPLCSEKGLVLECRLPPPNFPYLVGDPMRLTRLMVNLVGNAVKYTYDGSVIVDVGYDDYADDHILLLCNISDTGVGIPGDKLPFIFEKFVQADNSATRRFGGTGLGLNISRHIVNSLGGEIGVDSTEGKGSRFWFQIPFETSDTRPVFDRQIQQAERMDRLPADQRKAVAACRLLAAEDHLLNQAYIQKVLQQMGFTNIDIVANGQEALDAIAAGVYDIVLMDCHMPVVSGYDAAQEIRSRGLHDLPVIAMTADAMAGTRERCLRAGMDDYISKPMSLESLRFVLSRWITFENEADDIAAADTTEVAALRSLANDPSNLHDIAVLFIQQSDECIGILRAHCIDGPCEEWVEAAHKLKGSAAVLRSEALATACDHAQALQEATSERRLEALEEIVTIYKRLKNDILRAASLA